jgi:3-isopropylmalate dehydrogenase
LKVVTRRASERIARYAFDIAIERQRGTTRKPASVVCVSKSNVLPKSDGLFVKSCASVSKKYPSVAFSNMYVDTAAMNLVRNPEAFDVIVTSNMYGDILSDEASQLVGGLGLAPSANIGDDFALFEPVHGAAPDIAGRGIVNPIAMFLSVKMLLDWLGRTKNSKECFRASKALLESIYSTGQSGIKTLDIGGRENTKEVAQAVAREIRNHRNDTNYASAGYNELEGGGRSNQRTLQNMITK